MRSFQELELAGKIRYLRVVNDKDIIPTVPVRPYPVPGVYQHPGVELRLYRNASHSFRYPTVCNSRSRLVRHRFNVVIKYFQIPKWCKATQCCFQPVIKFHGCHEYMARLDEDASGDLKTKTLTEILNKAKTM